MIKKINFNFNKIKRNLLEKWSRILVFIIGLLGINNFTVSCAYGCPNSGCSVMPDSSATSTPQASSVMTAAPAYGVPSYVYDIKGIIKASDSKNPVPGIQIKPETDSLGSSVLSGSDGSFVWDSVTQSVFGTSDKTITLTITDVDGSVNGSFSSKNVTVTIAASEYNGNLSEKTIIKKTIDIEIDPVK